MLSLENWRDVAEITGVLATLGVIPIGRKMKRSVRAMRDELSILRGAARKIDTIEHEITTNSGASLKDVVTRMAQSVGEIRDDLALTRLMARSLASSDRRIAMFQCDGAGMQQWVNEAWMLLTGLTLEQMRGWGWLTAVHEEDRERVMEEWEHAVTQRRIFIETFRYQHVETGVVVEVRCTADIVVSAAGRPLGWIGTSAPVTRVTS